MLKGSISLLNFPHILRLRRNHALEHATMQILARKNRSQAAAGYSDLEGFSITGRVSTEDLQPPSRKRSSACALANPNWPSTRTAAPTLWPLAWWPVGWPGWSCCVPAAGCSSAWNACRWSL